MMTGIGAVKIVGAYPIFPWFRRSAGNLTFGVLRCLASGSLHSFGKDLNFPLIAIVVEYSLEMVIGLLGILKAD
ncbi:MAG: hypothetical protein GY862_00705 [Gammaproteobacteria bacterium]|nr:hypothetical protein [Gammaproteobacteria bacterium]